MLRASNTNNKNKTEDNETKEYIKKNKWIYFSNLVIILGLISFSIVLILSLHLRKPTTMEINGYRDPFTGNSYNLNEKKEWANDLESSCNEQEFLDNVDAVVVCYYVPVYIAFSNSNRIDVNNFYYELADAFRGINNEIIGNTYTDRYSASDLFVWVPIENYVIAFSTMVAIYSISFLGAILLRKNNPETGSVILTYWDVALGIPGGILPSLKIYQEIKNNKNK